MKEMMNKTGRLQEREQYEPVQMEIITFECAEVITASGRNFGYRAFETEEGEDLL